MESETECLSRDLFERAPLIPLDEAKDKESSGWISFPVELGSKDALGSFT